MAIANYSELISVIVGWLARDDLTLQIPNFVRMIEARLDRILDNDPDREVVSTLIASGRYVALPADFQRMVSIAVDGRAVTYTTPKDFAGFIDVIDTVRLYTVVNNQIGLHPIPITPTTVSMVYAARIPALGDSNPTNWLMTRAPDVYVYGTLLMAELFGWNDQRLPLIKLAWDEAISELRVDAGNRKMGAGANAPRTKRH